MRPFLALTCLAAVLAARPAAADTCTWDGANNDWNDGTHWSCGHVPDADDEVIVNAGTVTVAGTAVAGSLVFANAVLNGAGTLTITGLAATPSRWDSGEMRGGGTTVVAAGAALRISGVSLRRTLRVEGDVAWWPDEGDLVGVEGAVVVAAGADFELFDQSYTTPPEADFEPALTVEAGGRFWSVAETNVTFSAAVTIAGLVGMQFVNFISDFHFTGGGTISGTVNSGGTTYFDAGTFTLLDGADIRSNIDIVTGRGNVVSAGATFDVQGAADVSRATFDGALVTGPGDLSVSLVTFDGGQILGPGRLLIYGATIDGASLQRETVVDGAGSGTPITLTWTWGAGGPSYAAPASVTVRDGGHVYLPNAPVATLDLPFTIGTDGNLWVLSGTVSIPQLHASAGTIHLHAGGRLRPGDPFVNTGRVVGDATLDVDGLAFTNTGTFDPGTPENVAGAFTDTLTVAGDYANHTLALDLRPPSACSSFPGDPGCADVPDLLAVTGAAALGGTLELRVRPNTLAYRDTLTIVTCGAGCTGTFDAVAESTPYDFVVLYEPNRVRVVVTGPIPPLANCHWNGSTGSWHDAFRWSCGRVPGEFDRAHVADGAASVDSDASVGALTLTNNGIIEGTAALTLTSAHEGSLWSNGRMQGTGTTVVAAGATLSAPYAILHRPLAVDGAMVWTPETGAIYGSGSVTVRSAGTLTISGPDGWFFEPTLAVEAGGALVRDGTGTVQLERLTNGGAVTVAAGGLRLIGAGAMHTGTFAVADGTELRFSAGTHAIAAGTPITGPGALVVESGAVLQVDGTTTLDHLLLMSNGVIEGAGTLTLTGATTIEGNTVMRGAGTTVVPAGAALTLRSVQLRRPLLLDGTATWAPENEPIYGAEGQLTVRSGGALTIAGVPGWFFEPALVVAAGGALVRDGAGVVELGRLTNGGAVSIAAGGLRLTGSAAHTGTFAVADGAELWFSGGTQSLPPGSPITGPGALTVNATTLQIDGATTLDHLLLTDNGVIEGAGTLTLTGAATWSNGQMRGTGTTVVAAGASLRVVFGTLRRPLAVDGAVTWTPETGSFAGIEGAIDVRAGGVLTVAGPSGWGLDPALSVEPGGTLVRDGAGTVQLGTLHANAGVIRLVAGGLRPGQPFTNTGRIEGDALLDVDGVAWTNAGTIAPGDPVGTLTVQGSYASETELAARAGGSGGTPVLELHLRSAAPGAGHDRLAVAGNAALGGTLDLRVAAGHALVAGDVLTVLTCGGTCAGTFGAVVMPPGFDLDVVYAAQQVDVVVGAVVGGLPLTLSGAEGWRMLAPAYTDQTYDALLGPLWTQGFPGADAVPNSPEAASAFLYVENASSLPPRGFAPLPDQAAAAPLGRGFLAYVYEDDDQVAPGTQGGFPKLIPQSGTEHTGAFPFALSYSGTGTPAADGWNLLGNPFAASMDWDAAGWTRTNVSDAVYVWDPAYGGTGGYRTWNGLAGSLGTGLLAPNQGFMVRATGPTPALEAPARARTTGGVLHGRVHGRDGAPPAAVLHVRAAAALGTTALTDDVYVVLMEGGAPALDAHDAFELGRLSATSLALYALDGEGHPLDVAALPAGLPAEVALGLSARDGGPVGATVTLTWPSLAGLPEGVPVTLRDLETGAVIDLRTETAYTFTLAAPPEAAPALPLRSGPATLAVQSPPRFTLLVGAIATAHAPDPAPAEPALFAPAPNPAVERATLRYDVAAAGRVRIAAYDLLGREVAVLADGERAPGRYTAALDASALAAGVYVVRMTADGYAGAQRVTIAR